ncbi:RidA family protein [Spirosoma harenae]
MRHFLQVFILFFLLILASDLSAQQQQYINPLGLPTSKNYTQVVVTQANRIAYISGQVSANEQGEILHKSDFKAQTQLVHENLKTALAAIGATFADVIKLTAYVVNTDPERISIVREVRRQYIVGPNPPASTYVGVQGLYDKDVLIEIEAIVALK